ncbi:MAG TPA: flagellar motor switch protein FliM [Lachnospiraceae bacterium]|nr:flagellar motor switch protein FliM [Lachnospiraceae bacterium]
MGEVLSQNEIDSLLQALSSGELDADDISSGDERSTKNYDFRRPAKFSKEHLRTLEIIFEHYGRLLSTNLPVYLRKNIQVSVVNSEACTFSEFSTALANPVLLGIVSFEPLNGSIMVELAANLGFTMVDRMLGGPGSPLEKSRDFSEIERTIVDKMMAVCVGLLREPWKNVVDITPVLERVETNPQFAQIIAPSEMIAIVTLNIKIGDVEGLMNVCLPYFTLESVMDKLNTKYWFASMKESSDENYVEYIESVIRKVGMPIKAVLGKSTITVSDFVNLQCGDIIKLGSKVDSEMEIYVGNLKKFKALPGSSKDSYAVRVTQVLREEE